MSPANRVARFEKYRYVGTREDMRVYDCDDEEQFAVLGARVVEEGLLSANQLQAFAPDTAAEARNRGFRPAFGPPAI